MHATVSGCGDNLAGDDADAIDQAKAWFSYLPGSWRDLPPVTAGEPPAVGLTRAVLPDRDGAGYDMHRLLAGLVDADSFFEVKPLWAPEVIIGFARLDGHPVGIVASNPMHKGGVLFVDSADKAARFIWLCDAFNLPLVFLADVPGFMIGTDVERQGIIRHGAKMISAVTDATVPKICVVVRKAYGAGLYAFCGPAFDPIATLALPTATIAVMGPEPAVNAVYANKIAAITDPAERHTYIAARRAEYEADVDLLRLASELVIDAVTPFEALRDEIISRLAAADPVDRQTVAKRHGVPPV
jgi:acetyl-CoA carboxylase carboxyltransferase component